MKVKCTKHTPASYCEMLERHGWQPASGCGGSFCRVYLKGDTAIKVGTRPDWAYLALARKIMRWGKRTPYLPVITSAHRMLSVPTLLANGSRREAWFLVVVMERLESCEHSWPEIQAKLLYRDIERGGPFADLTIRPTLDRRLTRVLGLVTRVFPQDWHNGNVMLRPRDGQVVVTDPIYSFRTNPIPVKF